MDELIGNLLKLQTLESSGSHGDATSAQAAEVRSKIPPQVLGHYDRFLSRGKKALVAVSNQVCTGCHMRLPLAVIMKLRHREDIQLCDSCGRYLYLPDEPAAEPVKMTSQKNPVRSARRRRQSNASPPSLDIEGNVLPAAATQPRLSPE